tara:strand:- start:1087 stop:2016 length:930 start_codon:yes stop_codon:yes gene_type:complete
MNFFKPKFWDKNKITIFSILLFPLSLIIKLLILIKHTITKTHRFPIPVICVGNIYLGGTGKTPLSIEIFNILKKLGMQPAFIRKKYDAFADEVVMQKKIGPIFQNKKRVAAVELAIQNNASVVILDDGFQDSSINKNFSIICFNERQWIGNGLTIPSGPLREELSALKRANCVVINGKRNIEIEKKILSKNEKIKIFYSAYHAQNAKEFKNKKVTAFAGIGNPVNFFELLKKISINAIDEIKFPDHYNYPESELKKLSQLSKRNGSILLTTEKDYFRIKENFRQNINFIKIKTVIENEDSFLNEIKKII